MNLFKRLLQIILALIGLIVITAIITLWIDSRRTSYLEIDKNEPTMNDSYLITNVNVIPMNQDTILTNKMVYIKDGIIKEMADKIQVDDIQIIDAKDEYLMPGLIDMHVHVWDKYELGLYLANGVTAVRNLWGLPMHLRLKDDIEKDEILAPSFFTTGPKLTGPEFIGDDNLNLFSAEEAREKVIAFKENGYDFIKTYYGLTEDIFDAVIEEAKLIDMDIVAHPSQKVPFLYHLNPQIKSIEHAEEIVQQPLNFDLDTLKLRPIIDTIADYKNANYCPTITVFNNIYQMMLNDSILDSEALEYMNPMIKAEDSKNQFERWFNTKQYDPATPQRIKNQHDFHLTIVKKLHGAGVTIICGTDAGIGVTIPGFSIHKELAFYKEAGLSNYEVLKTATINAAQTHKLMNNLGSIEPGKTANLILIKDNPIEDLETLKNPEWVMVNGRQLNKETLDEFKDKAKGRTNLMASGLHYVEYLLSK
jgi:hypothetical protein